jgi:hypothetical protein
MMDGLYTNAEQIITYIGSKSDKYPIAVCVGTCYGDGWPGFDF